MLKHFVIIVMILSSADLLAQGDSVLVTELNSFKDGIYLTHEDYRKNSAIEKENIITSVDKEKIDFYSKVTGVEYVTITSGSNTYTLDSKSVWGFVQNKTLFVNYNGSFYRVPVFGAICYFAGVVEVTGYYNGIYDPMFGTGNSRAVKTKETHEFLMSYYNGKIIDFDPNYLELLLSKDEEVHKQFKNASRNKKSKEASRFVRMFNERHPVYYVK